MRFFRVPVVAIDDASKNFPILVEYARDTIIPNGVAVNAKSERAATDLVRSTFRHLVRPNNAEPVQTLGWSDIPAFLPILSVENGVTVAVMTDGDTVPVRDRQGAEYITKYDHAMMMGGVLYILPATSDVL